MGSKNGVNAFDDVVHRRRPWCYIDKERKQWDYCDCTNRIDPRHREIRVGNLPTEEPETTRVIRKNCVLSAKCDADSPWDDCGRSYRGDHSKTENNKTCLNWDEQVPRFGQGENNYCRNPDSSNNLWCYIKGKNGVTYGNCKLDVCKPGVLGKTMLNGESKGIADFSVSDSTMHTDIKGMT